MMAAGNLANVPVIQIRERMDVECALNPEAVLDYDAGSNAALCVKAPLNVPRLSNEDLASFIQRLNIKEAMVKNVLGTYGAGSHIQMRPLIFNPGQVLQSNQPYAAEIDLADPTKQALFTEYGLDRWQQVRGVLQSMFPEWKGVAFPEGTVFGRRAGVGLCQELAKFGRLHYLVRGIERWIVIPREHNDTINDVIREHLRGNGCPANLLECPHFLKHGDFVFDEDYLVQNFGAEAFDLVGGECLFLQAGIFAQVVTRNVGFSFASNCVPKTWLGLDALAGCVHTTEGLTTEHIMKIKRVAVNSKDYAAAILQLASTRQETPPEGEMVNMELPIPVVPQPIGLANDDSDEDLYDVLIQDAPQQAG